MPGVVHLDLRGAEHRHHAGGVGFALLVGGHCFTIAKVGMEGFSVTARRPQTAQHG